MYTFMNFRTENARILIYLHSRVLKNCFYTFHAADVPRFPFFPYFCFSVQCFIAFSVYLWNRVIIKMPSSRCC